MGAKKKPVTLYKLLRDGKSPHMGFVYSLPSKGEPGDWQEARPEALQPHVNGFHLSSVPDQHWRNGFEVYEVETEGEVLGPLEYHEAEYVARKVRLVRRLLPADLDKLGVGVERSWRRSYRADPGRIRKRVPTGASPVIQLLRVLYDHTGTSGNKSGDNLFNSVMRDGFSLAVKARMQFGVDDIATIMRDMDGGDYGVGNEYAYGALVQSGNASAFKSWEKWSKRTPWLWVGERLYEGAKLRWLGRDCKVTSIRDKEDTIIACAYRREKRGSGSYTYETDKVEKRFTITRKDLAEVSARRKAFDSFMESTKSLHESVNEALGARIGAFARDPEKVSLSLIRAWTEEQRTEALNWAGLTKHDAGKTTVKPPECPRFIVAAVTATAIHGAESKAAWDAWWESVKGLPDKDREDAREARVEPDAEVSRAHAALCRWEASNFDGTPADHLNSDSAGAKKRKAA